MPSVAAALRYAEGLGWPVFPVGPDCRRPLTEHGVKDASSSPPVVRDLWRAHPDANIALACGERSGVFALDVDCKGADGFATLSALEARHGALPVTWRQSTPSGGAHLLFRQPDRKLRNRVGFAPGLDVRTDGGSIALSPSRKPVGAYRWVVTPVPCEEPPEAPLWLLELIDPPPPPRPKVEPLRVTSSDRAYRYVVSAVRAECDYLSKMPPHSGRNLQLFKSAANLGGLVAIGLAPQDAVERALEAAAHDCGLLAEDGAHQVRQTIASGLRAGLANPREVTFG
jgi:hypothetical protein